MTNSKDKTAITTHANAGTTTVTKEPKSKLASKATTDKTAAKGATSPQQTKGAGDAWQKRVGAAHKVWSKISESDLKKSEGQPAKLAELVQERYSISRTDADKQVKNFIDQRPG